MAEVLFDPHGPVFGNTPAKNAVIQSQPEFESFRCCSKCPLVVAEEASRFSAKADLV